MIDLPFVSLHNHTSFSITEALTKPSELFERAAEFGQEAIAVTDSGTMAGLWDAFKSSKKSGVRLIPGCEFKFVNDVNDVNDKEEQVRHIILLAKNAEGYRNLLQLNKKGYDNFIVAFKKAVPRIDWNLLKEHSDGVICLTGCGNGIIPRLLMQKNFDLAKNQSLQLKEIFEDNLAFELQPHALKRRASGYSGEIDQQFINGQLKKLSEELGIRSVVTTNSHYLKKEHHKAQDVLLAIGSGQPLSSGARLTYNVPEFYVKDSLTTASYFIRLKDFYGEDYIKSLFENTIYFSDQCKNPLWIDPKHTNPSGKELPEFPVRNQEDYEEFLEWKKINNYNNLADDVLYLRYRCELGFKEKVPVGKEDEYRKRLEEELDVLEFHGFSSYTLIVADFVEWARNNGIRVGPGRGSVGGSIIAYLIGIHQADPIKYKLIFARFHNKEKKAFPDIDLDFSPSGRDKVQGYIRRKYGDDYVAHVSNVNTITPKVYARDISRVFEFGGDRKEAVKIGNEIADIISSGQEEPKTVREALNKVPLFAEYAKQYPELEEFADLIGGKARAWSTHAGGIIIGKRPLADIVPVRRDVHGALAVEYDKEKAEDNGLVKMDTLGLETLDIISETYKLIEKNDKKIPEPFDYNIYDEDTYKLISEGNVFGVFQLAATAVPVCKLVKPMNVEDIAIITSLVRPSSKAIISDFVKVRNGEEKLNLIHEKLRNALGITNGFGLFEESLMYIASDIAGWDLNKADNLRKMTKDKGKNPEKVRKTKQEFLDDSVKCGLDIETVTKIWDDVIDPFQGYGFNLSHATLYSMISFQTAYLKTHFPLEFLVANLKSEVTSSNAKVAAENILRIKDEIRQLGVNIIAPNLNTSDTTYKIVDEKTLMTGLDALKYIGKDAIPEILAKRPFHNFEDFLSKTDSKKVRAPAIQALAASGCLDQFGVSRKLMFLYASDYKKKFQVWSKKSEKKRTPTFEYPWPELDKDWTPREKFALEKYYLGEGISGSIRERFEGFFDKGSVDFRLLTEVYEYVHYSDDEKENRRANSHYLPTEGIPPLKGIITNLFSFKVKKEDSKIRGQVMARITVQDPWGNDLVVIAFPATWKSIQDRVYRELSGGKHKLETGIAIMFSGDFQYENEHTTSFIIDEILDYREAPTLPDDLKGKSVKLPRSKKIKLSDIEELDKESLAQELEDEMINEGVDSIYDEEGLNEML